MKRLVAFSMLLVLTVVLLAACGQQTATLESQSLSVPITVGLGYDFHPGQGDTNFNGQFDKGETLVGNATFEFLPLEPEAFAKGEIVPIGEAIVVTTHAVQNLREATRLELPVGPHQVTIHLTDKPFGPDTVLPPTYYEIKKLADKYVRIRYVPMIYCGGYEGVAYEDIEYCIKLKLVPTP
jgi:hypothetical protein